MHFTRVKFSNWRNFKNVDVSFDNRLIVVGPNAAGKSNFLDVFRFISDIAKPGGSLSEAIQERGGLNRVRSLFARTNQSGRLLFEFHLQDSEDTWVYRLSIKGQKGGKNLPIIDEESVFKNGQPILQRPNTQDESDAELLTQTHLQQISVNQNFRVIADHFSKVQYFHLVPQVIRDPFLSGLAKGDPHGVDFISRINSTPQRTRKAWLRRIERALQAAVPEFESLEVNVDSSGKPHLIAGYRNWRAKPTRHTEAEFSDGTLRLLGLLWTVVSVPSGGGILLLEEPELSLNSAIVRMLPTVLAVAQRDKNIQVVFSTHAPELLDDEGVVAEEILVLNVTADGTHISLLSDIEEVTEEISAGLPLSEIVHSLISPQDLTGLISIGKQ